jgi:hypothetical protein
MNIIKLYYTSAFIGIFSLIGQTDHKGLEVIKPYFIKDVINDELKSVCQSDADFQMAQKISESAEILISNGGINDAIGLLIRRIPLLKDYENRAEGLIQILQLHGEHGIEVDENDEKLGSIIVALTAGAPSEEKGRILHEKILIEYAKVSDFVYKKPDLPSASEIREKMLSERQQDPMEYFNQTQPEWKDIDRYLRQTHYERKLFNHNTIKYEDVLVEALDHPSDCLNAAARLCFLHMIQGKTNEMFDILTKIQDLSQQSEKVMEEIGKRLKIEKIKNEFHQYFSSLTVEPKVLTPEYFDKLEERKIEGKKFLDEITKITFELEIDWYSVDAYYAIFQLSRTLEDQTRANSAKEFLLDELKNLKNKNLTDSILLELK